MNTTTITVNLKVKKMLDKLKRAKRESYSDVLSRVLPIHSNEVDIESLKETASILSDPDTMERLARSMDDFNHGRLVDMEDL
jgi:predicted CopG family antitoxin